MAKKTLTRFVVEIGGELKRLFTVREAKKGLLIITTDADGAISTNRGQASEILTFKHTIHTSDRSETKANLVHMTQEYANGSTKETFALTHAVRDGTFLPIYQRLAPDPRQRPSIVPHHKDVVISLGTYDPASSTLIYGIWLSSAKAAANFPTDKAYSSATATFRLFSVTIAFGFRKVPSTNVGTFLHYATTSEEKMAPVERQLGYLAGVTDGAYVSELPPYVVHEMNEVIDLYRNAPFAAELMRQKRIGIVKSPEFLPTPP